MMFTSMFRSVFSGIAAASVLGSSLALSAKASEKPKEITVGYLNLVNAQLVTKNLGLISKEMPGVKIKYVKVGGGGDMLRAIAAKQVDFGGLGNPPTAIGVTRGLPIQGTMVLNMLGDVGQWLFGKVPILKPGKILRVKLLLRPLVPQRTICCLKLFPMLV